MAWALLLTALPAIGAEPANDDRPVPEAPVVRAWLVPTTLEPLTAVWCGECRRWHVHGSGDGYRRAHCTRRTVYSSTGYVVRQEGPIPPRLRRDFHSPRPRGPEALGW